MKTILLFASLLLLGACTGTLSGVASDSSAIVGNVGSGVTTVVVGTGHIVGDAVTNTGLWISNPHLP